MNWYKANMSLAGGDEETIVMRVLGVSENCALGLLHRWLTYINAQTSDGVTRLLPEDLDRVLRYDGDGAPLLDGNGEPLPHSNAHVYHALNACGWVTLNERGEVCSNAFDKHNSQSAKDRACAAARVAKSKRNAREKAGNGQPLPRSNGEPSLDKIREEYKEKGSTNVEPKERRGARPAGAADVDSYLATLPLLKLTPHQRQGAAAAFYDEMESVGWVDKQGRNVWDWHAAARRYAARWAENEHAPFWNGQRRQGFSRNTMTSNGNGVNDYDIRCKK